MSPKMRLSFWQVISYSSTTSLSVTLYGLAGWRSDVGERNIHDSRTRFQSPFGQRTQDNIQLLQGNANFKKNPMNPWGSPPNQIRWLEKETELNKLTKLTSTATASGAIVMLQNQHDQQATHAANTVRTNMHWASLLLFLCVGKLLKGALLPPTDSPVRCSPTGPSKTGTNLEMRIVSVQSH